MWVGDELTIFICADCMDDLNDWSFPKAKQILRHELLECCSELEHDWMPKIEEWCGFTHIGLNCKLNS